MIKLIRLMVLASLLLLLTSNGGLAETTFNVHLIHINDHHSHLVAENYSVEFDGVKTQVALGGFDRVAAKIHELRGDLINPLVLHIGDALQGTLYYTLFKGEADADLMNLVGFDAFELGNHEFDDGNAVLAQFLKRLNFPVLAANIDMSRSQELNGLVQPYLIKEFDGERVGLIGIDTLKTLHSSSPGKDLVFFEEVETAKKMVAELESLGIDKIILMTHYGYRQDIELAKQVAGVDVILGGDSHTLLGDLTELGLMSKGSYPTEVTSPNGEPVCIAQAWQYSYMVGALKVGFDDDGVVSECEGDPILLVGDTFEQRDANGDNKPVDAKTLAKITAIIADHPNIDMVKPDRVVAQQLAQYSAQLEERAGQVIGQAADDLLHIRIPGIHPSGVELPNGSHIAPLVAQAYLWQLNSRNYQVDFVIQNAGGVRMGVPKGDITIETAYTLLPFANTLYVLEMSGAEVRQVLEEALSHHFDQGGSDGSFPYGAAIRYTIELDRPKFERITRLERRVNGVWEPVRFNDKYRVGINSFLTKGKDGYTTFSNVLAERGGVDTYFDYAESFVNYVKEVGTLTIPKETSVMEVTKK